MKKRGQQFFIGHCPMCGLSYGSSSVEIIRKSENATIVHAECDDCRSAAILTVFAGLLGMVTTMGMLTDMTREDVERFWNAREITGDDVLRAHISLEKKINE
jgi:hypothetical protein